MSDGPEQHPTTKIAESEIVKGLLKNLEGLVREGFAKTDDRLEKMEASQELIVNEHRETNKRLTVIEVWKDGVDDRLKNNSMRAKQESQTNESQDDRLKNVEDKLDRLLDIATHAKEGAATIWQKVKGSPYARLLAVALFVQLSNYLYQRFHIQLPPIGGAQ